MTRLEKLQAEARLRFLSPQLLYDMQESLRLKCEREKLADDFMEVLELAGFELVYLKRYRGKRVSQKKLLDTTLQQEKINKATEQKAIKKQEREFKRQQKLECEQIEWDAKQAEKLKRKEEKINFTAEQKAIEKQKRDHERQQRQQRARIEWHEKRDARLKKKAEKKLIIPSLIIKEEKQIDFSKVAKHAKAIRDGKREDRYQEEERKPILRPPAVYSNRNSIDYYLD